MTEKGLKPLMMLAMCMKIKDEIDTTATHNK